jgi:DNA processing protein
VTSEPPPTWRLGRGEPGYPPSLLDLDEAAPKELYGCGQSAVVGEELASRRAVTIVGSRRASSYGLHVAEDLGRLLAAAGLVIVSGMALGIDAAAHRGALAAGGTTIAVLAGGPDVVYPQSKRALYREIVRTGAVVSEAPPGRRPESWAFPVRNRIMAALGTMTVVVEAAQPSGTLITAGKALELGRALGAVPGLVTSRLSEGANGLIADGAVTVRGAQDVLDCLFGAGAQGPRRLGPALDPELAGVVELVERGASTCDAVARGLGAAGGEAAVALARLELLGYLRTDASGRYQRTTLVPTGPDGEGRPEGSTTLTG